MTDTVYVQTAVDLLYTDMEVLAHHFCVTALQQATCAGLRLRASCMYR